MLRSYSLSELCTIILTSSISWPENKANRSGMIEFVLVISRFKLSLMLLGKKEFRDRCTSILGMQMLFILAKHISERLSHSFLLWLSVTRIELASSKQAFFGSEELLSDLRKMLSWSSSHTCFDFNPLSLTEQNRLAFFCFRSSNWNFLKPFTFSWVMKWGGWKERFVF